MSEVIGKSDGGFGSDVYLPDYDQDTYFDVHESHALEPIENDRERCKNCGVPSYWPIIRQKCRPDATTGKQYKYDQEFARETLHVELEAFFDYWIARGEPESLPSMNEWAANWFEWRRSIYPRK